MYINRIADQPTTPSSHHQLTSRRKVSEKEWETKYLVIKNSVTRFPVTYPADIQISGSVDSREVKPADNQK